MGGEKRCAVCLSRRGTLLGARRVARGAWRCGCVDASVATRSLARGWAAERCCCVRGRTCVPFLGVARKRCSAFQPSACFRVWVTDRWHCVSAPMPNASRTCGPQPEERLTGRCRDDKTTSDWCFPALPPRRRAARGALSLCAPTAVSLSQAARYPVALLVPAVLAASPSTRRWALALARELGAAAGDVLGAQRAPWDATRGGPRGEAAPRPAPGEGAARVRPRRARQGATQSATRGASEGASAPAQRRARDAEGDRVRRRMRTSRLVADVSEFEAATELERVAPADADADAQLDPLDVVPRVEARDAVGRSRLMKQRPQPARRPLALARRPSADAPTDFHGRMMAPHAADSAAPLRRMVASVLPWLRALLGWR